MERLNGMLFGAFVADAYALGLHWIYDTDKLKSESNHLHGFISPARDSFHKGKRKGEFTHYGDQSLLLLKSISTEKGFSRDVFKTHWMTYMEKYEGYIDHATRESLTTLDLSTRLGSSSDELGGYARVAPLIFYHFDDPKLKRYVEEQTRLTHNNETLLGYAQFFTDLVLELIIGKDLNKTIEVLIESYPKVKKHYLSIKDRLNEDTISVIKDIGQSCASPFAVPASLYLILKYADDYEEAMKANVLSGGDSAGRGMVIGMILGAYLGISAIPKHWIDGLVAKDAIQVFSEHKRL